MVAKGSSTNRPSDYRQSSLSAVIIQLLKDYFLAIIGAAFVAIILRVYVVEAFRIPTDFMSPALLPGDLIFVNKLAYSPLLGNKAPERGDVVIFSFPNDPAKDYIKRVIALPGDTVALQANKVILNGKPISREGPGGVYDEELPDHKYSVLWNGTTKEAGHMTMVKVPQDSVFVLGDNRAKGQDSRSWGFLPTSGLKGRASIIWFSSGEPKSASHIRWSRLFKRVD